jgi:hypothetical protein
MHAAFIWLCMMKVGPIHTGTIKYFVREKENTEYLKLVVDELELLVSLDLMTI